MGKTGRLSGLECKWGQQRPLANKKEGSGLAASATSSGGGFQRALQVSKYQWEAQPPADTE